MFGAVPVGTGCQMNMFIQGACAVHRTPMQRAKCFTATSPVANKSISGCWLEGSNSPFSDTTGIYEITTDKCMYIPTTIVVPVEPGTGGEITPVLPGGGTIVTPAN